MKVSTKAKILLAEATITSIVGLIDPIAGILLTYGLVLFRLYFDKEI